MKFDVEAWPWGNKVTRAAASASPGQEVAESPRDQVLAVALRAMAHSASAGEAQARTLQFYRRARGAWVFGLGGEGE